MDQAIKIILGFVGPLTLICIVGIFYMLYPHKKEDVDQKIQA
jgi:cbb3-type cytochrome oxidase subunit 3